MKFNSEQFRNDIIKKQYEKDLKFKDAALEIGTSCCSLWKATTGQTIGMVVFVKILGWLGTDPNRYFTTYIKN